MVWTDTTRRQYVRKHGRYASDCSDDEWELIAPFCLTQDQWQAAYDEPARCVGCCPVNGLDRLPVGDDS